MGPTSKSDKAEDLSQNDSGWWTGRKTPTFDFIAKVPKLLSTEIPTDTFSKIFCQLPCQCCFKSNLPGPKTYLFSEFLEHNLSNHCQSSKISHFPIYSANYPINVVLRIIFLVLRLIFSVKVWSIISAIIVNHQKYQTCLNICKWGFISLEYSALYCNKVTNSLAC